MSPSTSPEPQARQPPSRAASHTRTSTPADATSAASPTPSRSTGTAGATGTDPSSASVSRRTHAKSRTGCRTCKRRKIKCDEQRPSCRNCIKHAVRCDFVLGPAAPTPSPGQVPREPSRSSLGANADETTRYHGPGGLNMVDLELIHNFTTFTHTTLSSDHGVRQMLKTTAIRMAFDCEFLMRAILALSAVHLSHFRRDRRDFYDGVAMDHHQVACRLAVSVMNNMDSLTQADCENLHLFSVLTMFISLGSPKSDNDSLVMGESMLPSWLTILRNAEPILSMLNPQTYKGPLGPLFAFGRGRWRVIYHSSRPQGSSLLVDLQSTVNKTCTEPELLPIYNDVLDQLRRFLSMLVLDSPGPDNDGDTAMSPAVGSQLSPKLEAWDIFVWQWDAAKDLIPLLRGSEPRQEAVVIYAHFLIMLKKLESQWWLEGWARHMMERVWAALDEEHRLWIQWPIEELGWVPP